MEIEFEILIVLNTAILFFIAYFLSKDYKPRLIFSLISAICWMTLAVGFMATNPTFPAFSLLFLLIFIILVLATLYDTLELLREQRWKPELE